MVIRTQDSRCTKGNAIWILVKEWFRQTRLASFIIFFVAALQLARYLLWGGKAPFPPGLVIAAAYVLMLLVFAWASVTFSKKNKMLWLWQKGHWEINQEFLTACFEDGSVQRVGFNDVKRVIKTRTYFQLLLSGNRLIHIPFNEFYSGEDLKNFETLLTQKRLIGS